MNPNVLYRVAGTIAVVILFVIPLASSELGGLGPLVLSSYFMHLAITAFFYAILASSWSLLAGYAGQFSFGHMAFMAIGGYTSGLIGKFIRFTTAPSELCADIPLFGNWWLVVLNIRRVGTIDESCLDMAKTETLPVGTLIVFPPVWASIAMGLVMGAVFGLLVGWLVLRLRSTYLALFTIGFSEILRAAISAEIPITEGQSGLELVPLFPGGMLGIQFDEQDSPLLRHAVPITICDGLDDVARRLAIRAICARHSRRRRGGGCPRRQHCPIQGIGLCDYQHSCGSGRRVAGPLHRHHHAKYA